MTDQQQATDAPDAGNAVTPVPVPEGTIEAWNSMIASVPDADSEGGYERILAQLAQAQTEADLNAPWDTGDMERMVNIPLTITWIAKSASEYKGGLPWFLIVDAAREDTGESITLTTGSVNIVAQLTRAWVSGLFPVRAVVRLSERETRNGFRPQRLEFLPRKAAAANGSGATA